MAESIDIRELNMRIEQQSGFVTNLVAGMNRVIVGQKHLIDSLLISLLSDGHILLEGAPGLAKTLAIKTLSQLIDAEYSRIQFTPDLLPADVIGTLIYSQKDNMFQVKKGPVFANFVLADEITVLLPRCRARCWRPCRSIRSPSVTTRLSCQTPSSLWQHRTPLSKKVHISCPRHRWTVSC